VTSVHEHLAACLEIVRPLPPLEVVLHDAVGCLLAQDAIAPGDLPAADLAAVDGYAVDTTALRGSQASADGRLRVLDDLISGTSEPGVLVSGTAVRIASGCLLPIAADAVVPLDETDLGLAQVALARRPVAGEHVRRRGEDLRAGEVVLPAGTRLGARQIGLLAGAGLGRVLVHPRPRVVVLPVGSDLVEAGRRPRAGGTFDSNGHALACAAQDCGVTAFRVAAVPDVRARLREAIEDQMVRADVLVLTGGLSDGREDVVQDVLTRLGQVRFHDVAMSPGSRCGVGRIGDGVPVLALPGHPVAAQIAFELFVRPVLRTLAAETGQHRLALPAASLRAWGSVAGRRDVVPGMLSGSPEDGYRFAPTGDPEVPTLSALARANALALVPEGAQHVQLGDELTCLVIDA
jgi:molybdopterin molybdotransferase